MSSDGTVVRGGDAFVVPDIVVLLIHGDYGLTGNERCSEL